MKAPFRTEFSGIVWGLVALLVARLMAMVWVPLTDPTESRYAEIARKMVETGNWITPQFDYGVPFWAKPPLHTWLSALGIAAFGSTAFAARIGILLTTVATLTIMWRWGCAITERKTAAAAVLITASSGLFFVAAAFVETDMVLTLGVVASMTGFHRGIKGERRWGWLFFLGLAIGLLGKGPVAVVLTGTPIFVWMICRGNWKDLWRLPWIGGVVLCLVLVVPWYVLAEVATPGFLKYFIIGEHIQRFLQPGWSGDLYGAGRAHPRGTIWLYWIVATLPWSPLLPLLLRRQRRSAMADGEGLHLYLLLFALTPLVFFTAAANILIAYVIPGLPAAAMLATILWTRSERPSTGWLTLSVAEIVVLALGATAFFFFDPYRASIPSEDRLISEYHGSGRLALFGSRSFSAEFYTNGKIYKPKVLDDLAGWLKPGDGVLVQKDKRSEFVDRFGSTAAPVAENQNYVLFITKDGSAG